MAAIATQIDSSNTSPSLVPKSHEAALAYTYSARDDHGGKESLLADQRFMSPLSA